MDRVVSQRDVIAFAIVEIFFFTPMFENRLILYSWLVGVFCAFEAKTGIGPPNLMIIGRAVSDNKALSFYDVENMTQKSKGTHKPMAGMSPKKNKEAAEDAAYAASLLRKEHEGLLSLFQATLKNQKGDQQQLATLVEVMAEQFALLSARLTLLETIILESRDGTLMSRVTPNGENEIHRATTGSKPKSKRPVVGSKPVVEFSGPGTLLDAKKLSESGNSYSLEGEMDGGAFCWSGPQAISRFLVTVSREETRKFSLHVVAFSAPDIKETLKVKIDSREVVHEWVEREYGSVLLFSAPPSPQALSPKTQISIELARTHCPAEHDDSSDIRKLGMAMTSLTLVE